MKIRHFFKNRSNYSFLLILFMFFSVLPNQLKAQDKIVSLKPNITEILFNLGVGNDVVGVTTYCDYPPQVKKIEKVADYIHVDAEKVLRLKPTLVIGSKENSLQRDVQFLKKMGLKVALYSFSNLDEIEKSILSLGELVHQKEKAASLVLDMNQKLEALTKLPKPIHSFVALVGHDPMVVVGGANFLSEALGRLGFENVFKDSRIPYPVVGLEEILRRNPDMILDMSMGTENGAYQSWQAYSILKAVQQKHVYRVDVSDLRPSPRLVDGLARLMDQL